MNYLFVKEITVYGFMIVVVPPCNLLLPYIHIPIHTYIHMHTYIHIYIYINTYVYIHIYSHIYNYLFVNDITVYGFMIVVVPPCNLLLPYIHIPIHTYIHTYINTYICMHIYIHTNTYVYIHIYSYIHIYLFVKEITVYGFMIVVVPPCNLLLPKAVLGINVDVAGSKVI
jgi:hypothetical protein